MAAYDEGGTLFYEGRMARLAPVGGDRKSNLPGLDFVIDRTWDGQPVDHEPIRLHLQWHFEKVPGRPHKRVINFEAPLFDDPDPPDALPGICPEVGPHGHWLCILHDGIRKPFNNGEELELEVENVFQGNTWKCTFEIPLAYLPGGVSKFNAYAIHGSGEGRVYEALNPVTDGSFTEPDFHRLQFFQRIDLRKIVPDGYGDMAFNDLKYGQLWEDHL